jgi:hypothetical protein
VPREPVRTTLRFAPSAPLVLRPFGCAFGHPLVAQCPYEGEPLFQPKTHTQEAPCRPRFHVAEPNTIHLIAEAQIAEERRNRDVRISININHVRLVQDCPAIVPQFFTTWAPQAQYATYAHAFLLSFFVTVENKRFVNPTPKRKVVRGIASGLNELLGAAQELYSYGIS